MIQYGQKQEKALKETSKKRTAHPIVGNSKQKRTQERENKRERSLLFFSFKRNSAVPFSCKKANQATLLSSAKLRVTKKTKESVERLENEKTALPGAFLDRFRRFERRCEGFVTAVPMQERPRDQAQAISGRKGDRRGHARRGRSRWDDLFFRCCLAHSRGERRRGFSSPLSRRSVGSSTEVEGTEGFSRRTFWFPTRIAAFAGWSADTFPVAFSGYRLTRKRRPHSRSFKASLTL